MLRCDSAVYDRLTTDEFRWVQGLRLPVYGSLLIGEYLAISEVLDSVGDLKPRGSDATLKRAVFEQLIRRVQPGFTLGDRTHLEVEVDGIPKQIPILESHLDAFYLFYRDEQIAGNQAVLGDVEEDEPAAKKRLTSAKLPGNSAKRTPAKSNSKGKTGTAA